MAFSSTERGGSRAGPAERYEQHVIDQAKAFVVQFELQIVAESPS